jgi:hypothetical protein
LLRLRLRCLTSGTGEINVRCPQAVPACQPASKTGSDAKLVLHGAFYDAPSKRARSRSSLARPYIWRFTSFSLVFCPSVCPFDHGSVRAAFTAQ